MRNSMADARDIIATDIFSEGTVLMLTSQITPKVLICQHLLLDLPSVETEPVEIQQHLSLQLIWLFSLLFPGTAFRRQFAYSAPDRESRHDTL